MNAPHAALSSLSKFAACAALALAGAAHAAYPDRPITLLVGFPAGGGVDVVGRILGQELGDKLGTPVIVENKAGFSGNLAAQQARRAPADGHTLLMTPSTTYSLAQKLMGAEQVGYDLTTDFAAVSTVGTIPLVLLANTDFGVGDYGELKTRLQASSTPYAYGSSGVGSIEHVAMEMLRLQDGLELTHVPYRGSSPTMTDLLGGQIPLAFATAPTALANLPSGRVRPVGIASTTRLAGAPDVPTFAEQGVEDFVAESVFAVLVRSGTPTDRIETLNAALQEILADPAIAARLAGLGVQATLTTPAQAQERLQAEVDKWSLAIERTGISAAEQQ